MAIFIAIVFLLILAFTLYKVLIRGNEPLKNKKEFHLNIVALVIGILLGSAADMVKDEIKESSRKYKLNRLYYSLLKKQACDVNEEFVIYKKSLMQVEKDTGGKAIPYQINLQYWNYIKTSPGFIDSIFEKPFDRVSEKMLALEELNDLISAAKLGNNFARLAAVEGFQAMLDENFHGVLLKSFQDDIYYGVPKGCN